MSLLDFCSKNFVSYCASLSWHMSILHTVSSSHLFWSFRISFLLYISYIASPRPYIFFFLQRVSFRLFLNYHPSFPSSFFLFFFTVVWSYFCILLDLCVPYFGPPTITRRVGSQTMSHMLDQVLTIHHHSSFCQGVGLTAKRRQQLSVV